MELKYISRIIKPFLPTIKDKAGITLNDLFRDLIISAEKYLQTHDGEKYAGIVIVRKKDISHILVAAFSEDDKIQRIIQKSDIKKFTDELINKIYLWF